MKVAELLLVVGRTFAGAFRLVSQWGTENFLLSCLRTTYATCLRFAGTSKPAHSFKLSPLRQTMASIMKDLSLPDEWHGQWVMQFCAIKGAVFAYKSHVPP